MLSTQTAGVPPSVLIITQLIVLCCAGRRSVSPPIHPIEGRPASVGRTFLKTSHQGSRLRSPDETATLLPSLISHSDSRADPIRIRAAPGRTIGITETLARDELRSVPLPDILATGLISTRARIRTGISTGVGGSGSVVRRRRSGPVVAEPASLLSGLELRPETRADPRSVQRRAAGARAVG